ncbi:MAG: ribbon-helix-helix domain-containing protein [Xanthobacteraceae bacterium]
MFTKHSIRIAERVTTVSMEEEFWDALRDIAADRNTTLSALLREIIAQIDGPADGRRIASMLRVFILEQYMPAKHLEMQDTHRTRRPEPQSASKVRK